MPKTWLAISVELLGGRGETLWPTPVRVFAVGPSHTFTDFAVAIDAAFARWDLSHLRLFTLPDGRTVTDAESAEEFGATPFGALPLQNLDIDTVKVARTVKVSDEFKYVFDLGDDWTHACTVEDKVDPVEAVGLVPEGPPPPCGDGGRFPTSTAGAGPTTTAPTRHRSHHMSGTRCSTTTGRPATLPHHLSTSWSCAAPSREVT